MTVFPVIIDSQPEYLRNDARPTSLLLAPLGTGTVLSYLRSVISKVTGEELAVFATFEPDADYAQAIHRAGPRCVSVISGDRFDSFLASHEPSDWLLLLDPRCFPVDESELAGLVPDTCTPRCVKHLVALESGAEGTREFVQLDADSRVRRIERRYEGVTWIQVSGVACSLVSVASALHVADEGFESLPELRGLLMSNGVPGHDVSLSGDTIDLTEEGALLGLMEQQLLEATAGPPAPPYTQLVQGVHVGQRCRIHPTARIYGPVLIQHGVSIEPEVAIIGPTLIGAASRVERNSVVAQCLLLQDTLVPRETTVRHRVLGRRTAADPLGADRSAPPGLWAGPKWLTTLARTSSSAPRRCQEPGRRSVYPIAKRMVDVAIALLSLVVLSPLLIVVAAMIKLGSRGPVLFGDEREGKDGRVFRCWKFRTMAEGAHLQQRGLAGKNAVDGPQFKLPHDPRVTGVGHWLRAANIDELAQLVNVLLGQMSLIGPRPSPFRENQICVPWRRSRLSVRPGITGLWQVCRHERSAGDFHQWIYYDMLYVRHMSFSLDLRILAATLFTLGGRWSVPLSWLIPERKVRGEAEASEVLTWTPVTQATDSPKAARQGSRPHGPKSEETVATSNDPLAPAAQEWIRRLRSLALRSLGRMYRPDERLFGFRIRRTIQGDVLEGISNRYTATVLIGLSAEPEQVTSDILAGQDPQGVCGCLIDALNRAGAPELGEVALTLWAARVLKHPHAGKVLDQLRGMAPAERPYPTVELSWSLASLAVEGGDVTDDALAASIAGRLIASFAPRPAVFPRWPKGGTKGVRGSILRPHVSCFADQVYPIQALSHYYARTGESQAIQVAQRCAEHICALQGTAGQWWWHYDVRTGRIVEGYPVYAVHQDAMAPMALFALQEACGVDYGEQIEQGLAWLARAPETGTSLVDWQAGLIWRKVARHEFRKWSRGAQAWVSRIHPALRVPGLDLIAPPHAVDYECRPYHLGWLLHAWVAGRLDRLTEQDVRLTAGETLQC